MKFKSWAYIVVLSLAFGVCCDQQAFAQKRKPAKKADDEPKAKAQPDGEDPDALFPAPEQPASPVENAVRQAQDAYHEGRFEACIDLTTQVLDAVPRHAVARYHRASALIELGRRDRAIEKVRAGISDAREALSIAGKQHLIFHIPYFYGLTSLAEMENRPAHADLVLKVATPLLLRPDLPKGVKGLVYYQRALAKMFLKDYAGAAADYGEGVKIDPEFQAAHFGRADAYLKAGQPGQARESYDQAVKLMPTDPLVYNNRGTFQLQQGRTAGAIADYTKALELEPEFAMAALNRGFAHAQQLDWSEAEKDYLLAVKLDPQQVLALKLLGVARIAQGKLSLAVDVYSEAIQLSPQDADNYSGRGFVHFFAKDYADAATDFAKAQQLKPTDATPVPWKYWAQTRSGQEAAAKTELEAFVKAQPATPNWQVTLCRYILGTVDDQTLLKSANDTSDARAKAQWLCEAHFFQGLQSEAANKPDEARQHFEACMKTNQSQLTAYLGAKVALDAKK